MWMTTRRWLAYSRPRHRRLAAPVRRPAGSVHQVQARPLVRAHPRALLARQQPAPRHRPRPALAHLAHLAHPVARPGPVVRVAAAEAVLAARPLPPTPGI